MTDTELVEARRTIERLEGELARTKKVQEDLWSHDIYLKARGKMFGAVLAILGVLSALGLWTAYDIYSKLVEVTKQLAEETIKEDIDAKVDDMVASGEERLQRDLDKSIAAVIAERTKAVDQKIALLDTKITSADEAVKRTEDISLAAAKAAQGAKKIADTAAASAREADKVAASAKEAADRAEAVAQEADAAATRLRQLSLAGLDPDQPMDASDGRPIGGGVGACHPSDLKPAQRALVRIRQTSEKTDAVSGTNRPVYANAFQVASHNPGNPEVDPTVERCLLAAIDRVVYDLDKRWFSQPEIVRVNAADRFGMSVRVWGVTNVDAAVYFKGDAEPTLHYGSMLITEGQRYLEPGKRPSNLRGQRPY